MIIIFTVLYSLYLPLILKFKNLRPQIYHTINDINLKKKWMKNKTISEILIICSLVVLTFVYYIQINETINAIMLNLALILIICSIIISLINNKKHAGRFGIIRNKFLN